MTETTQTASSTEATQNPQEAREEAAEANKIETTKFVDLTDWILGQLQPGDALRFGDGWMLCCPDCKELIFLPSTFKTFTTPDRDHYRISPSVVCPNEKCQKHMAAVIEGEGLPEEPEKQEEEAATEATSTQAEA